MRRLSRALVVAVTAAIAAPAALSAQEAGAPAFVTDPAKVRSGEYVLDPAHGKITWSISHLGYSTYIGQFPDVEGTLFLDSRNPEKSRLEVTVRTDSAGTFHPDLDAHLKTVDFFDVANHPTAEFRSTSIRRTADNKAEITGDLTLRGVTKQVVIEAVFNQAGVNPLDKIYSVGFDGTAVLRRSDFGIEYALPLLGDEVKLQIEGEFKYAAEAKKAE